MENKKTLSNKQKAIYHFEWTLRKYRPVFIAYCILMFMVFPLVELCLLMLSAKRNSGYRLFFYKERLSTYGEGIFLHAAATPIVAFIFSTVFSLLCFSYLHNKRLTDLYGSLPLNRKTLFLSRYFSAATMSIVPILVNGIIGALLTFDTNTMPNLLMTTIKISVATLGNVSFIAFISVCCGLTIDTIVSTILLNAMYPLFYTITIVFPSFVLPGFSYYNLHANLFTLFCPAGAPYTGIFSSIDGEDFFDKSFFFIAWWCIISIIVVALATILCKKRKAEAAQSGFAFPVVEIIIKFFTCFTGGLAFGYFVVFVFEEILSFGLGLRSKYFFLVSGFAAGIMIINFLTHLIFHKGIENFRSSLKECGVVFIFGISFIVIVCTGFFGYDAYVPNADDVQSVSFSEECEHFYLNGRDILPVEYSDRDSINAIINVHNQIAHNATSTKYLGFYNFTDFDPSLYNCDTDYFYYPLTLKYHLKNGKNVKRIYTTNYGDVDSSAFIDALLERDLNALKTIPKDNITTINVIKSDVPILRYYATTPEFVDYSNNTEELKDLIDEVIKDCNDTSKLIYEPSKKVYELNINYEDSQYNSYYVSIPISFSYSNTMKKIEYLKTLNTTNDIDD